MVGLGVFHLLAFRVCQCVVETKLFLDLAVYFPHLWVEEADLDVSLVMALVSFVVSLPAFLRFLKVSSVGLFSIRDFQQIRLLPHPRLQKKYHAEERWEASSDPQNLPQLLFWVVDSSILRELTSLPVCLCRLYETIKN